MKGLAHLTAFVGNDLFSAFVAEEVCLDMARVIAWSNVTVRDVHLSLSGWDHDSHPHGVAWGWSRSESVYVPRPLRKAVPR